MPASLRPRAVPALFGALAILAVLILVLWVYPGYLKSNSCPLTVTTNLRSYCSEVVQLVGSPPCTGVTYCVRPAPANFTFQGVSFFLILDNSTVGPQVRGEVIESGSHWGVDMVDAALGQTYFNWTSPDQSVFIGWQTPFATWSPNGWMWANVTCGVHLG